MNIDELERLAKAANPFPLDWDDEVQGYDEKRVANNLGYARACSPERILAMIACIKTADKVFDAMETQPWGENIEAYDAARAKLEKL